MLRPLLAAALAAALLLPPATALLGAAEGCPAMDFLPGTQLVAAPGGQWVKATFRVDAPLTADVWAEVGLRVSALNGATEGNYGFFAERALAAAFVEDLAGNELTPPSGLLMYPYGIQLDAPGLSVRIAEGDAHCGAAAAGTPLTLAPGTYVAIGVGATETMSETALALPDAVQVLAVQRGPLQRASEAEFDCLAKGRVEAAGFSSEGLVGCATPFRAEHKAYRALSVGHAPSVAHDVRWTPPNGETTDPVVFFDLGTGEAGTWRLDIPLYASPVGEPFYAPVPGPQLVGGDSGVFGAFADVP